MSRFKLSDYAASALPAYLDYFAIFDEHWDVAPTFVEEAHSGVGFGVGVDVVFDEILAGPLEPFAKLAREWALRGSVEFKRRHGSLPPGCRE